MPLKMFLSSHDFFRSQLESGAFQLMTFRILNALVQAQSSIAEDSVRDTANWKPAIWLFYFLRGIFCIMVLFMQRRLSVTLQSEVY